MTQKEAILHELQAIPDSMAGELLDFIRFLKLRAAERNETALLSESSLCKDWSRPEEDEAWKNL
jgi:hypothetical protein